MEGKQTPCPACKRIVKVPMQVKQAPKDWRTIDTRPGASLRKDAGAAPKDAWGTESTVSSVSQAALEEAGALPEDLEPLPWSQRLKWPLVGMALVAVLFLGFLQVRSYFASSDRDKALAQALTLAYPPAGKEPLSAESAAVLYRSLGEFYGRWGRSERNPKHVEQGLAELRAARQAAEILPKTAPLRDSLLADVALSFVDLGGDKQQVKQGVAILWDEVFKEIRSTVAAQQTPEVRADTLRQLTQKLLDKTDFDLSGALTSALAPENAKPEAVALIGLELMRLNRPVEAAAAAERAQRIWDLQAAQAKTTSQAAPTAPSLVALWLVLKKDARAEPLKASLDGGPNYAYSLGAIESQARLGQFDTLRGWIKGQGGLDQARYLSLVSALSLEQDPKATTDLDALTALVTGPLKGQLPELAPATKTQLSWLLWRVVRLAARAGHDDQAKKLIEAIPDSGIKSAGQLEAFRARVERGNAAIDDAAVNEVDPKSTAHRAAREAYARHRARQDGWTSKQIDSWEADWRPFGYAGISLGIQDKGR